MKELDYPEIRKSIIFMLDDQESSTWNAQYVGNITFPNESTVKIHTTRPGLLIGKGGKQINQYTERIKSLHPQIKNVELTEISLWGKEKRI